MLERFKTDDDYKWGLLVKSWATGNNYFDSTKPAPPLPRTLDELKAQCAAVGLTVTIPSFHTGLVVVQSSKEILMIKLPSKALVEATEAEFEAPSAGYPVPAFYDRFYTKFGSPLIPPTKHDLLEFHACRIGDYSIRMCG